LDYLAHAKYFKLDTKMNSFRVIIGPSSFAEQDKTPLRILESAGITVLPNPVGRRWKEEEAIQFLKGVDGLVAGLEPLNRKVLESARGSLKALARVGIGMTNVDQEAAREFGIKVSNTPEGPMEAVAEMTLAALLTLVREIEPSNRRLHAGEWPKTVGRSVAELTVLMIGYGRIGRRAAALLKHLGARILIFDPLLPTDGATDGNTRVSLAEGLGQADVVSLHASGEKVILGAAEFAQFKPGTILLNSARGGLVDEAALIGALDDGRIGKAWFDAFWKEPYQGKLLQYPQVLLTPHMATYTRRCRLSMESQAANNLIRDLGL
jgi:D-3-phosphoglycerate dehydrogenase